MTNDDYNKIKQLFESGNAELSFALSESVGSNPVKFMNIFVGEKMLNGTGFDL